MCIELFSRLRYQTHTQKDQAFRGKIKQCFHHQLNPLRSVLSGRKKRKIIQFHSPPPLSGPRKETQETSRNMCLTQVTPGDPKEERIPSAKEGHACELSGLQRKWLSLYTRWRTSWGRPQISGLFLSPEKKVLYSNVSISETRL